MRITTITRRVTGAVDATADVNVLNRSTTLAGLGTVLVGISTAVATAYRTSGRPGWPTWRSRR